MKNASRPHMLAPSEYPQRPVVDMRPADRPPSHPRLIFARLAQPGFSCRESPACPTPRLDSSVIAHYEKP